MIQISNSRFIRRGFNRLSYLLRINFNFLRELINDLGVEGSLVMLSSRCNLINCELHHMKRTFELSINILLCEHVKKKKSLAPARRAGGHVRLTMGWISLGMPSCPSPTL